MEGSTDTKVDQRMTIRCHMYLTDKTMAVQSTTVSRWLAETTQEEPWRGVKISGNYQGALDPGVFAAADKDSDDWSMAPEQGSTKSGGR